MSPRWHEIEPRGPISEVDPDFVPQAPQPPFMGDFRSAQPVPVGAGLDELYANGRPRPLRKADSKRDVSLLYANSVEASAEYPPTHAIVARTASSFFAELPPPFRATNSDGDRPAGVWAPSRQTLRPPDQTTGFDAFGAGDVSSGSRIELDIGRRGQLWADPTMSPSRDSSRVGTLTRRQEWLGRVEAVSGDRFVATLTDAAAPEVEELAEFLIDQVAEHEQHRVRRGARFYWVLGYRDQLGRARMGVSIIQFQRAPSRWTDDQRRRARARARRNVEALGLTRGRRSRPATSR